MLKLVLIALEILKRIQQSRGTIKVSLTYQSQCSGITYQDALTLLVPGRGRIGPRTSKTLITQNHLIGTS